MRLDSRDRMFGRLAALVTVATTVSIVTLGLASYAGAQPSATSAGKRVAATCANSGAFVALRKPCGRHRMGGQSIRVAEGMRSESAGWRGDAPQPCLQREPAAHQRRWPGGGDDHAGRADGHAGLLGAECQHL